MCKACEKQDELQGRFGDFTMKLLEFQIHLKAGSTEAAAKAREEAKQIIEDVLDGTEEFVDLVKRRDAGEDIRTDLEKEMAEVDKQASAIVH